MADQEEKRIPNGHGGVYVTRMQLDKTALERLIGGNTEVEVNFRNSVMREVISRGLNELLESQVKVRLQRAVGDELSRQIGEFESWYGTTRFKLAPAIQDAIKQAAATMTKTVVDEELAKMKDTVEKLVSDCVTAEVVRRIKDQVIEHLKKL